MEIEERIALLNERDQLKYAIQRVRELAHQLDDYDWKTNEASYQLTGHLVAVKILEALDREQ